MATTAASMGTPQPKKKSKANLTAAKTLMGSPGGGAKKRPQPYGGQLASKLQQAGGSALGRAGQQRFSGPQARGWGAPAQYGGSPMQGGGGGGAGGFGGYPGSTNWWSQRPQMPGAQQWGSPRFNYQGGYAPSAQQGPSPPWGGGGGGLSFGGSGYTPYGNYGAGGAYGGGGMTPGQGGGWDQYASQLSANQQYAMAQMGGQQDSDSKMRSQQYQNQMGQLGQQQMPGQYQTGGRPQVGGGYGQQQYGGGMPQGGMPSYQMPGMQNTALGPLQNRIWQQRMETQMPSRLRNMYRFQGAAQGLGIDPNTMPGYGTQWGYNPQGWYGGSGAQGTPWASSKWGSQSPGMQPSYGGSLGGGPPGMPWRHRGY